MASRPWQVAASAHVPDPEELRPGWMPSSRSLAFRREAFDGAGGYPEWLAIGEDMFLNHRWIEQGHGAVDACHERIRQRVRHLEEHVVRVEVEIVAKGALEVWPVVA